MYVSFSSLVTTELFRMKNDDVHCKDSVECNIFTIPFKFPINPFCFKIVSLLLFLFSKKILAITNTRTGLCLLICVFGILLKILVDVLCFPQGLIISFLTLQFDLGEYGFHACVAQAVRNGPRLLQCVWMVKIRNGMKKYLLRTEEKTQPGSTSSRMKMQQLYG